MNKEILMNQKSKTSLNIASLMGFGVLIASAVFFRDQFPLYAWVIWVIIAGIYSFHQKRILGGVNELNNEIVALSSANSGESVNEKSEVAKRKSQVLKLAENNKMVSPSVFREILGARQASKQVGNGSYAVVLLGLLGTFIGLAEVVGQAGVISGDAAKNIEAIIPQIFSNMQGIFGTTLCGLAASFFLRKNEETLEKSYLEFYADLEEYTQFELLPSLDQGSDNPITDSLNKLTQTLNSFPQLVEDSLHEPLKHILGEAHEKLLSSSELNQRTFSQSIEHSIELSSKRFSENHEALLNQFSLGLKQEFDQVVSARESFFGDIQSKQSQYFEKLENQMSGLGAHLNVAQEIQNKLLEDLSVGIQSQLENSQSSDAERLQKMTANLESLESKHQSFLGNFKSRGEEWMNSLQSFSENLSAGITKLNQEGLEKISEDFQLLADTAKMGLESTTALSSDVQEKLGTMMNGLSQITDGVAQSSEYMKVNQVEMQSTIEMFNKGVELLVENLSREGDEDSDQMDFYKKLETTLEIFHEKASESLVENSIRTQEILLQVLSQSSSPSSSQGN